MQLILNSEPALDNIQKDMSAIEDIHTEKVCNGDIEKVIEKNCNGNKENIGEANVINSDEKNKHVISAEIVDLPNSPIEIISENIEDESSISIGIAITEETSKNNIPDTNGTQKEESQKNATDEEIQCPSPIEKESEEKSVDIVQEAMVEDKEDTITINQENLDQIPDITENKSENTEPENNETKIKEKIPGTIDDMEVIEEHTEIHTICETTPVVKIKEPVTEVQLEEPASTENEDKPLEASENEDKPLEASENKDKPESSENRDKPVSSENKDKPESFENKEKPEFSENRDKPVSSENEDKPEPFENKDKPDFFENKDKPESSENRDKPVSSENKDKPESFENKDKPEFSENKDLLESSENKDIPESSENKDKPESLENKDKPESSENKDKPESSENKEKQLDESKEEIKEPASDSTDVISSNGARDPSPIELQDDMDVEEIVETTNRKEKDITSQTKEKTTAPVSSFKDKPIICKLSNTLDILSDDEDMDEPLKEEPPKPKDLNEKQCINIEDDDDIMLIDEDTSKTEPQPVNNNTKEDTPITTEDKTKSEIVETREEMTDVFCKPGEKDSTHLEKVKDTNSQIDIKDKEDNTFEPVTSELPLLPDNFLKSAKKNISDMTREDLEEFCILKIVESIVDRSNLSEIKNKLKTVAESIDEYRKKTVLLTKQNRDIQVVLKSVQEEQKKNLQDVPITPLKITRSVGMQVYMEKPGPAQRRKNLAQLQNSNNIRQNPKFPNPNPRPRPPTPNTQIIPVPRLVPASPFMKSPNAIPMVNQIVAAKVVPSMPNGVKVQSPSQKVAEKRSRNRNLSVTVDLTDDEPPTKVNNNRTSPAPPVRLVPSQNLMANPRQAFPAAVSSPRKVYIPISGPQNQNIRPGQTIMLKTVPTPALRPRMPNTQVGRPGMVVKPNKPASVPHPAPLPEGLKQYQPPNWKALPPAPELKLSKVENGIVISWKIEGYQEDSYEEIASYQLYAYQETSAAPSTSLWKKIGDVKALPLPMACTLTQFMAGFKYFFAVRAVDIRSRLGPFSKPNNILLLNKL